MRDVSIGHRIAHACADKDTSPEMPTTGIPASDSLICRIGPVRDRRDVARMVLVFGENKRCAP
eukprot:914936-Rhodomonas_salina.1